MSDQIKQIAERLQGLRDVLELTPDEVAKSCQLSVEEYLGMESGEKDISVSACDLEVPPRDCTPRALPRAARSGRHGPVGASSQ